MTDAKRIPPKHKWAAIQFLRGKIDLETFSRQISKGAEQQRAFPEKPD